MTLKISALLAEFNFGLSQMKRISPPWNCGILQIPDISFPWLSPVPMHTFAKSQYFDHQKPFYFFSIVNKFHNHVLCLKGWREAHRGEGGLHQRFQTKLRDFPTPTFQFFLQIYQQFLGHFATLWKSYIWMKDMLM